MKKFSPHLLIAKNYWKNFLKKDFTVIDATAGNGHDSLFIAKLLNSQKSKLYCFDIQEKAIKNTYQLLKINLKKEIFESIILFNKSHINFSKFIKTKVNLIIYNLGYLPKSNKTITTKVKTTLLSINSALEILAEKGAISITCYPGHKEGEKEEKELYNFLKTLDYVKYNICFHKWINKEKSPSFFWIEKK